MVFSNTASSPSYVLEAAGKKKEEIKGIGVAAPGPLDYKTGLILDAPLMGWKNFPLGERLRQEFGVPVYVENDGNLGALAEANVGVAKGENVVLYQTISTGWRRNCHRRRDFPRPFRFCRRVRPCVYQFRGTKMRLRRKRML